MIPWNKLPRQVQKYVLITAILSGSSAMSGCRPGTPIICDPVPPPPTSTVPFSGTPFGRVTTAPLPSDTPTAAKPATPFTPVICDPMPPPITATAPTRTPTPMICDPAPPPSIVAGPHRFEPRGLVYANDTSLSGAIVEGQVVDARGMPVSGIQVTAIAGQDRVLAGTDLDGRYSLVLPSGGDYLIFIGDDRSDAIHLQIKVHDRATLDWAAVEPSSQLPLSEIRTVSIAAQGERRFRAESPWPAARLRWSVSGGAVVESGDLAIWHPPSQAGRYLLQLVADWGRAGLAVSSVVLVVGPDGRVVVEA